MRVFEYIYNTVHTVPAVRIACQEVETFQSQVQITPNTPSSIFVEVTKMILTKVCDFCQLASHKHGSFSDLGYHMDFFPTAKRGWRELAYLFTFVFICFFNVY